MRFLDSICETVTRALGLSALTSWESEAPQSQIPTTPHIKGRPATAPVKHFDDFDTIQGKGFKSEVKYWGTDAPGKEIHINSGVANQPDGPTFKPPSSSEGFVCDYSNMKGWRHVGNADTRGAWLEKPISPDDETGGIYDVLTDNDHYWPTGVTRKYNIDVEDIHINADGVLRTGGKTYNREYPGPRLEACWGDWMEVTVNNKLKWNGTTMHFHGARQYMAFEADGVNGVTQCPIAPGDSHTYKFRVTQFGTSWYHSHYSLQYADGLAGPMVFYGPSAGNYDEAIAPYLFGDWSHNSAFEDFWWELHHPSPMMQTTILNGRGFFDCSLKETPNCDDSTRPALYVQTFERGRKYLLRLINTSTAATFIFSIDKHIMRVVSMDFIAIEPYYADSIQVGIGQRYNVIVEALPANDLIPEEDQNYWIRIVATKGCDDIIQNNPLVGIIRYNAGSTKTPTSKPYQFETVCGDEPYESLVPLVQRDVSAGPNPANQREKSFYDVGVEYPQDEKSLEMYGNFQRWEITNLPIWLNFSDPTINHVGDPTFNPEQYALVEEPFGETDWVYFILSAVGGTEPDPDNPTRQFIPTAHPVHLHGHDYTILAQERRPFHKDDLTNGTFLYKNPPRRDTVLLPRGGYVAIGFQADNPGIWVYHCHIAWHVSNGFSVQIREREHDIHMSDEVIAENHRVCANWDEWFGDKSNWWDPHEFQEDSGI